jgi:hypothetical protein
VRFLLEILLCMHLLLPPLAHAQQAAVVKGPFDYSLKLWALMLGLAVVGGFVSWYAKVRRGDLSGTNLQALIGELTTSAFAGVLTFFVCEAMNMAPLYTAATVGIAGHMGTKAIDLVERRLVSRLPKPADDEKAAS